MYRIKHLCNRVLMSYCTSTFSYLDNYHFTLLWEKPPHSLGISYKLRLRSSLVTDLKWKLENGNCLVRSHLRTPLQTLLNCEADRPSTVIGIRMKYSMLLKCLILNPTKQLFICI